jgi:hypothetical protein
MQIDRSLFQITMTEQHLDSAQVRTGFLLPLELQATAKTLNTQVAESRNEHVEHEMQYLRKRKTEFAGHQAGASPEVGMALPADGKAYPERPLRDLWILIHNYVTDVAKFLGSQIG